MSVPTFFPSIKTLLLPGYSDATNIHYQLSPEELVQQAIDRGQGTVNDTGALVVNTGQFNGRSPLDKFIVKDYITENSVNWNNFNIPIDEEYFHQLKKKLLNYLGAKDEVWVRDCYACAETTYRIGIRIITENPWSNLFAYNMFIRPTDEELEDFEPDWQVIHAPDFKADPQVDRTRKENFAIISFAHKTVLIGGTGYTGEVKKGIFTILNYILPHDNGVLSMHCSANTGQKGDTAIFFGLSGTGKTTLSADPQRNLIGDDEHGWNGHSVFNFEGGCYAKVIDLSEEKEYEIFHAVRDGALVENTTFYDGTNKIDFTSKTITENTRVSYPLHYISNALEPSIGNAPENIFFLTCDAAGVLPPISRLTPEQAMYHFITGYTAKVAGTETGITEPKSTFSACFGAPFLPLHPNEYAVMLGKKLKETKVNVWLVNTGWSGGPFGTGTRMKLAFTRAMITAALEGSLQNAEYKQHPVFGVMVPQTCPNVPAKILNPRDTWESKQAYDASANALAQEFINNFEKYKSGVAEEIWKAAPKVVV